jgi:hypothetical protein
MDAANYRIQPGMRLNSRRYIYDGFIYTKSTKINDGHLLRCVRYKAEPDCPGTALLKNGDMEIEPRNAHIGHGVMTDEQEVVLFADELKRGITDDTKNIKEVYARVAAGFPPGVVAKLPFERVKSGLYKIRSGVTTAADKRCPVCFLGKEKPSAFYPCGHTTCTKCARVIMDSTKLCPVCRAEAEFAMELTIIKFDPRAV